MPTRTEIEDMAPGTIMFSMQSMQLDWPQESITKLNSLVLELMDTVAETALACKMIKLIVFSGNFEEDLSTWKAMLGRLTSSSTGQNAVVSGTVLSWGGETPEKFYSIMILPEWVAAALTGLREAEGDLNVELLAKAVVAHELGHVHDNFVNMLTFGPETHPLTDDWIGIRNSIAGIIWVSILQNLQRIYTWMKSNLGISLSLPLLF